MSIKAQSAKAKGSRLETKVANMVGGRRAPLSGAVGGGDVWGGVLSEDFVLECKKRASIPALVKNALTQAATDLRIGDLRKPAVVIEEDHGEPIICIRLQDFLDFRASLSEFHQTSRVRDCLRQISRNVDEAEKILRQGG